MLCLSQSSRNRKIAKSVLRMQAFKSLEKLPRNLKKKNLTEIKNKLHCTTYKYMLFLCGIKLLLTIIIWTCLLAHFTFSTQNLPLFLTCQNHSHICCLQEMLSWPRRDKKYYRTIWQNSKTVLQQCPVTFLCFKPILLALLVTKIISISLDTSSSITKKSQPSPTHLP